MNSQIRVPQSLVFTILYAFCRKWHVLQFWMEGRMEGWRLNIIMSICFPIYLCSDPLFSVKCTFGSGALLLEFIYFSFWVGVRRESIRISKDLPSCDLVLSIYTESCRILTFSSGLMRQSCDWELMIHLWQQCFDAFFDCFSQVFLLVSLCILCVSLSLQWTIQWTCIGDFMAIYTGIWIIYIYLLWK